MDIMLQIFLNTSIFVLGLLCVYPIRFKLNLPLYMSWAWFVGWAVVVISEMILVLFNNYVTLFKLGILSAAFLLSIWLIAYMFKDEKALNKNDGYRKYFGQLTSLFLFCALVIGFLASFNYVVYTPDSFQYRGLAQMLHKYGYYDKHDQVWILFKWLFDTRLPFYVSVHNVAFLTGVDVFYSFMSTTTFFIIMGIYGFWKKESQSLSSKLLFLIPLAVLVSNPVLMFHSFYSHNYLITMAYYTFGVISIFQYIKYRDTFWFVSGCLFLGCTGILRKEMLLISIFPFIYLKWKSKLPKSGILLVGFGLYFIFSYLWPLCGLWELQESAKYFGESFSRGDRGGMMVWILCLTLSIITFFLPCKIKRDKRSYIIIGCSFVLAFGFLYYLFGQSLISAASKLYLLMFKGVGRWGSFWYIMILGFLTAFLLKGFSMILTKHHTEQIADFWIDKKQMEGLEFLIYVIFSFFLVRLVLYTVFTAPKADTFLNSGNRILLCIYPVSVYFLGKLSVMLYNGSVSIQSADKKLFSENNESAANKSTEKS